jgi:hypothetical protein
MNKENYKKVIGLAIGIIIWIIVLLSTLIDAPFFDAINDFNIDRSKNVR